MSRAKTIEPDYQQETRRWVEDFIVPLNICPFARKEIERNTLDICILRFASDDDFYTGFSEQLRELNERPDIASRLVVLPSLTEFSAFLNQAAFAQQIVELEGYLGIFQLANFHPAYVFSDSSWPTGPANDPANFTNRAPYPTLHILREADVERAVRHHKHAADIPANNIQHLRQFSVEELMVRLSSTAVRDN